MSGRICERYSERVAELAGPMCPSTATQTSAITSDLEARKVRTLGLGMIHTRASRFKNGAELAPSSHSILFFSSPDC